MNNDYNRIGSFLIQASDPLIWDQTGKEVEEYYQALPYIFEENTEDAIVIWNDIVVPVNYEHDLYLSISYIHILLKNLLDAEKGEGQVSWGSNIFMATWDVEWENNNVKISSHWDNVVSGEDLLNSRNYMEIPKDMFLQEWKMLLRKIIDAINQSGVVITNQESWNSFCEVESRIETPGFLYVIQEYNDEDAAMSNL
jgi:hypothetical protein